MMDDPAPAEWLTTAWFEELTRRHQRVVLTPVDLAGLMALFSSTERLRLRLAQLPAALPEPWHDPMSDGMPAEVAAAFGQMQRLNEWVILHVLLDVASDLPTGAEATRVLKDAYDRDAGLLRFERKDD